MIRLLTPTRMIKKPQRGLTSIAVGATHGIKKPKRVLAGFLPF